MNKKSLSFSILFLVIVLAIYSSSFIEFKYHVWYLSSESVSEREVHSKKITQMGNSVIPLIMDQLEHPYIFEEYYLFKSLSEITGIDSVQHFSVDRKKQFWKNWWQKHKNQF